MARWRGSSWSTTSVVIVALAAAVAGGGIQYTASHVSARPTARSTTAYAPPATAAAPTGLQLVMAGNAAADEAASATGASATGADGAEGPEGPAGLDGAAGVDGLEGAAGADGASGADGEAGPQGPAGSVGATGPAGSVGATGPAGIGLTAVEHDGGGFEFRSPDGVSYRIHVTNTGIIFAGPKTTQVWSDDSRFQTLVP